MLSDFIIPVFLEIAIPYPVTVQLFNHSSILFFITQSEISVIWLIKRSAIKLLILLRYYGKTNFEVQRNFNAKTTLIALFEIRFSSLLFDVEKRKAVQWYYRNTLRSFITDLFKRDAFKLYRDWNKLMINQ